MLKDHVKKLCMLRGINMEQVARECGISKGSLSTMINGHAMPQSRRVPQIASALGLTPAELVDMLMGPRA